MVQYRSHAILSIPHFSSQLSFALLGTGSANEVGETSDVERNRYQDANFPIFLSNTSEKFKKVWGVTQSTERARNSAPASGKEGRCISSSQVSCLDLTLCTCLIHVAGTRRES